MKKKLLLVEDMKGVRDSLEIVLKHAGFEIQTAANGKEGITKLEGSTFDLIVTDILMPEVDGTEVILAAKAKGNIPVLAISAGGNGVSAEQALAVAAEKADAVLEKPFSKDELLTKISEIVGQG